MEWPGHLGRELRQNLVGDIVVQALVLGCGLLFVRSVWLVAVWAVRWLVVGGVVGGIVAVRRRQRERALRVTLLGHAAGALATVLVLPQVAPLALLVVVGDVLAVARHERTTTLLPYARCGIAIAAVVGALSLQDWTGLLAQAPRAIVVPFVAGHAMGTIRLMAVSAAHGRSELTGTTDRLQRSRRRIAVAQLDTRRAIGRELAAGPIGALMELGGQIDELNDDSSGDQRPAQIGEAVSQARRLAEQLRQFSHQVYPDVLAQHGALGAFRALAARAPYPVTLEIEDGWELHVASAAYHLCSRALDSPDVRRAHVELRHRAPYCATSVELVMSATPPAFDAGEWSDVADRVEALGGDLRARWCGDRLLVRCLLPRDESSGTPTLNAGTDGEAELLHRFARLAARWLPVAAAIIGLPLLRARPALAAVAVVVTCAAAGGLLASSRLLRQDRPVAACAGFAATVYATAALLTALVPDLVPATTALVMCPLLVSMPALSPRGLKVQSYVQSPIAGGVALLGLLRRPLWAQGDLPRWIAVALVAVASAAVVKATATALAATHARLGDQARTLRQSQLELIAIGDRERKRIGRDLHDGAQQHVVGVTIRLRALLRTVGDPARFGPLVRDVQGQVASAARAIAELAEGVRPEAIELHGPVVALRETLAAFPRVTVRAVGSDGELPSDTATAVYFTCLEAVQNAIKHAGDDATVTVEVRCGTQRAHFRIEDDGVGFRSAPVAAGRGLRNLVNRIRALDGDIQIRAQPGVGTTVEGWLPLSRTPVQGASVPPSGP